MSRRKSEREKSSLQGEISTMEKRTEWYIQWKHTTSTNQTTRAPSITGSVWHRRCCLRWAASSNTLGSQVTAHYVISTGSELTLRLNCEATMAICQVSLSFVPASAASYIDFIFLHFRLVRVFFFFVAGNFAT